MDPHKKALALWKEQWTPVCDAISGACYVRTGSHPDTQSLFCLASALLYDAALRGVRLVVDPVSKAITEEAVV